MLIRNILTASAVAVSLALPGAVFAQAKKETKKEQREETREHMEKAFKDADKNHDGGLTRDEIKAAGVQKFANINKYFDEMDANKDGKVTMAERDTWLKNHKDAPRAKEDKRKSNN